MHNIVDKLPINTLKSLKLIFKQSLLLAREPKESNH